MLLSPKSLKLVQQLDDWFQTIDRARKTERGRSIRADMSEVLYQHGNLHPFRPMMLRNNVVVYNLNQSSQSLFRDPSPVYEFGISSSSLGEALSRKTTSGVQRPLRYVLLFEETVHTYLSSRSKRSVASVAITTSRCVLESEIQSWTPFALSPTICPVLNEGLKIRREVLTLVICTYSFFDDFARMLLPSFSKLNSFPC